MTSALSHLALIAAQASLASGLAWAGGAQRLPKQALAAGNKIGDLRGLLPGLAPPTRTALTCKEQRI
ncbi:hypothetical protein Pyn_02269 [Prunus yedoensis var. nudiflora]|uniref:Uncharacterized protein n=1 Tax=Prunus yedoensis var. nudiflora TaxID=2094558 RepID=A0A314YLK0_PRUYE|nr:hypothetical protein Pyn_02269 [Prunus yedoensis var. nudiflora]